MIVLKNITKKYHEQTVLENFNYQFNDTGFYLLFGPSGCGKTTLLNLIFGVCQQDKGNLTFYDKDGEKSSEQVRDMIGYIIQDSYFIDYLTIQDHFDLINCDVNKRDELLHQFNLENTLTQYPNTLSGGEKQRLSIILNLLQNKKVLLLDEPTASLNKENKIIVFEMLKKLKEDILIICVSHDIVSKDYCDALIDFNHLEKYKEEKKIEINSNVLLTEETKQRKNIISFINKKNKYKNHWRKTEIIFVMIVMLSYLMIYMSVKPEEKIKDSLIHSYHLNYLIVDIPWKNNTFYEKIEKFNGVSSIVYDYNNAMEKIENGMQGIPYGVLPLKESFYYKDHLLAGKYFTQKNEIMLGSDFRMLAKFSPDIASFASLSNEDLIGYEVSLNTVKGIEKFKIAGIFDVFDEKECEYFINNEISGVNSSIYMNHEYMKDYFFDQNKTEYEKETGKSTCYVYFNDVNAMRQFEKKYSNSKYYFEKNNIYAHPINDYIISEVNEFNSLSLVLIPLAIFSGIISILFYLQSIMLELKTKHHIFGIYQYYGYYWKNIKKGYYLYYLKNIIRQMIYGFILSLFFLFIINQFNSHMHFFMYQLMKFDFTFIFLFSLFLITLMAITLYLIIRHSKKENWYELIKKERDLL